VTIPIARDEPRTLRGATIGGAWLAVARRILTFQPHTDTAYIPCVSLLDFWLPGGAVELIAYAHSIDFGAKGHGNLVELARLQHYVAGELGRPPGRLLMTVKSAHVYETEFAYVRGILTEKESGPSNHIVGPLRWL
jgi:thymidylate synthase